jgi:hypothetical protein
LLARLGYSPGTIEKWVSKSPENIFTVAGKLGGAQFRAQVEREVQASTTKQVTTDTITSCCAAMNLRFVPTHVCYQERQ